MDNPLEVNPMSEQEIALIKSALITWGVFLLIPGLCVIWFLSLGSPDSPPIPALKRLPSKVIPPNPAVLSEANQRIQMLAQKVADRPNSKKSWLLLAAAYRELARYPEAMSAYEKALALDSDDQQLIIDYVNMRVMTQGQHFDAISLHWIEQAIKMDTILPETWLLAGGAAYDQGDYARAVAYWKRLQDILPTSNLQTQKLGQQLHENIVRAQQKLKAK